MSNTTKNPITGDLIQTKTVSDAYRDNFDAIFRKSSKDMLNSKSDQEQKDDEYESRRIFEMNEQRAFTVVVTGCRGCFHLHYCDNSGNQCMHESTPDSRDLRQTIYQQNKDAITPSCPMWAEAKPFIK